VCARCGADFPLDRIEKRYCSDRCRAAASRERRATKVRKMEGLIADLAQLAKQEGADRV
jgi:predicted nucleic acid-binding Zn ribbon protein